MISKVKSYGFDICATTKSELVGEVFHNIEQKKYSRYYFCPVHMIALARIDDSLGKALGECEYISPDGKPLFWTNWFKGYKKSEQIRGVELMRGVCERAAKNGTPIALYGGQEKALKDLVEKLKVLFLGINIVYLKSPDFFTVEDIGSKFDREIKDIKDSGAEIVFVGLGCPKQEIWIKYAFHLIPNHYFAVGAAFDFIASPKMQAPRILVSIGLEWLYRFYKDPKRLWKRYLIYNSIFIYMAIEEFFLSIFKKHT